jgi:hypothetical protein
LADAFKSTTVPARVGGEGERRHSLESIDRKIHVGDELHRAAAGGIVAVLRCRPIGEYVVAGAARDRIDAVAAADRIAAFVAQEAFHPGEPVSTLSVVNYDARFSFLGFYIVRPDLRGQGYGLRTWTAGLVHAGARTVGLDGVVAQQDNYRESGFALAYRNIRFGGTVAPQAPAHAVVDLAGVSFASIEADDATVFPASRPAFLRAWIGAPAISDAPCTATASSPPGASSGRAAAATRSARSSPTIVPLPRPCSMRS